jgi:hypothetical protein
MLIAVPFIYALETLLVHLYTLGRERHVLVGTLVASLLGTTALFVGLWAYGGTGAAVGYVVRQILFVAILGGISLWSRARLHAAKE